MIITRSKRKLKGLELHRGRKSKNFNCVATWFNAIGSIFEIRHSSCLHDHVTDHLLTTQVDQLRITSKQALEQTKPLIQTFPLANIKQLQYLQAVQHQVAQFFVDLNIEKSERNMPCTAIQQLKDELVQLRREVNEPTPPSLPVPSTVDPPCCTAFRDICALNNAQISKNSITTTLKRDSSTTSKSRLPGQPRGPTPTLPASTPSSSDLETRVKQLEEEVAKAGNCRETIISIYRSQFIFVYDRFWSLESGGSDTIPWNLTSLRLVSDTDKSATPPDDAATNPSNHYNSPVYRTHPHGYNFFVQFCLYGLDSADGNHASIMFAFFAGDYDGWLTWPFPKTILFFLLSAINLTPRTSGLSLSDPPRRYPFEG